MPPCHTQGPAALQAHPVKFCLSEGRRPAGARPPDGIPPPPPQHQLMATYVPPRTDRTSSPLWPGGNVASCCSRRSLASTTPKQGTCGRPVTHGLLHAVGDPPTTCYAQPTPCGLCGVSHKSAIRSTQKADSRPTEGRVVARSAHFYCKIGRRRVRFPVTPSLTNDEVTPSITHATQVL